jgi:hypothetical protein
VQRKEQEEKRKRAHALRDAADALLLETEGRLASLDHEEKHLADLRERYTAIFVKPIKMGLYWYSIFYSLFQGES